MLVYALQSRPRGPALSQTVRVSDSVHDPPRHLPRPKKPPSTWRQEKPGPPRSMNIAPARRKIDRNAPPLPTPPAHWVRTPDICWSHPRRRSCPTRAVRPHPRPDPPHWLALILPPAVCTAHPARAVRR
ncbi:hypothetical protein GSI_12144 [Ganoderma sinense ZZ0214-1]|uniref:Uncharacterized protein n=1 Tax=Ganoderma sinense ZZ0214-1 TaxID=1077348 RepID=A0A2G8RY23_9APHY|nr:hypothetical protein GSI_12144 [Ganoderma sinense ZZ0214-1]